LSSFGWCVTPKGCFATHSAAPPLEFPPLVDSPRELGTGGVLHEGAGAGGPVAGPWPRDARALGMGVRAGVRPGQDGGSRAVPTWLDRGYTREEATPKRCVETGVLVPPVHIAVDLPGQVPADTHSDQFARVALPESGLL
jgi:hypothetical protein